MSNYTRKSEGTVTLIIIINEKNNCKTQILMPKHKLGSDQVRKKRESSYKLPITKHTK